MTQTQLMTAGAVAFALFALYTVTRKPGQLMAAQPAQNARDFGLDQWMANVETSWRSLGGALPMSQAPMLGLYTNFNPYP